MVREKYRSDRDTATNNQIRGAAAIISELVRAGRVQGVIGIGGGTSTLVATSVMKQLPFGMPKLMASPMAAHPAYIDKYVGTHDITMHHTVLDIVKINPLLKAQIINAVGAICGMVEMTQGLTSNSTALRRRLLIRLRRDGGPDCLGNAGSGRLHPRRVSRTGQR